MGGLVQLCICNRRSESIQLKLICLNLEQVENDKPRRFPLFFFYSSNSLFSFLLPPSFKMFHSVPS